MKKLMALILAMLMVFSLASAEVVETESDTFEYVGMSFDGMFNAFFAENPDDRMLVDMTSATLLGTTPYGDIILDGESGMITSYKEEESIHYGASTVEMVENADGSVDYNITLRENLIFADGHPADIDDVIFTLYVLADPAYNGPVYIRHLPILGLEDYASTAAPLSELMIAAGRENTVFEYWDEVTQTAFWSELDAAGAMIVQEIVSFILENYLTDSAAAEIGRTVAEVEADPLLQLQLGMAMWGYSYLHFDGATAVDYWQAIVEEYGGDVLLAADTEAVNSGIFDLIEDYEEKYGTVVQVGEPVERIEGIVRTGDRTMTIRTSAADDGFYYALADMPVMPLHYYGDEALYDYENASFGFVKGDLSLMHKRDAAPLGCGEYSFEGFENGTVTLEANAHYFAGEAEYRLMTMTEG